MLGSAANSVHSSGVIVYLDLLVHLPVQQVCGQVVAGRVFKYVGHREMRFIIWFILVNRKHGVPNLIETVQTYVIDAYPQGGSHLASRVKSTFIGLLNPSGRGRGTFVTPARSSEEQFAKARAEVRY